MPTCICLRGTTWLGEGAVSTSYRLNRQSWLTTTRTVRNLPGDLTQEEPREHSLGPTESLLQELVAARPWTEFGDGARHCRVDGSTAPRPAHPSVARRRAEHCHDPHGAAVPDRSRGTTHTDLLRHDRRSSPRTSPHRSIYRSTRRLARRNQQRHRRRTNRQRMTTSSVECCGGAKMPDLDRPSSAALSLR